LGHGTSTREHDRRRPPAVRARDARAGLTDAALLDEALTALLAKHRGVEIDAAYSAYDEHPLEAPDEWGDLASFRRGAAGA